MSRPVSNPGGELVRSEAPSELLRELVAHLRQNRTQLREEWVMNITETRLLTAMTKEEIFAEATSVYDSYVEALETEAFEALQAYARNLSYTEVASAKISSLVIAVSSRVSVMFITHSSRNCVRFCRRCATSSRRSSEGASLRTNSPPGLLTGLDINPFSLRWARPPVVPGKWSGSPTDSQQIP